MRAIAAAAVLSIAASWPTHAADAPLSDGAYEVTYRLELPHLESREQNTATVCLKGVGAADGAVLPVLSANNPLARCPVGKVLRNGDALAFEIVCPGGNAAKAKGSFSLMRDRFQGAITMNMGGKNMTMTEVQRGRRVGECPASATR